MAGRRPLNNKKLPISGSAAASGLGYCITTMMFRVFGGGCSETRSSKSDETYEITIHNYSQICMCIYIYIYCNSFVLYIVCSIVPFCFSCTFAFALPLATKVGWFFLGFHWVLARRRWPKRSKKWKGTAISAISPCETPRCHQIWLIWLEAMDHWCFFAGFFLEKPWVSDFPYLMTPDQRVFLGILVTQLCIMLIYTEANVTIITAVPGNFL